MLEFDTSIILQRSSGNPTPPGYVAMTFAYSNLIPPRFIPENHPKLKRIKLLADQLMKLKTWQKTLGSRLRALKQKPLTQHFTQS
jgi:hypothetical protein